VVSFNFKNSSDAFFTAAVCALLLLAVGLVFGQTAHHEFINLDDGICVYLNKHVNSGLTVENVKWAFTHSCGGTYTPLTLATHMLDCQFYGIDAGKHHLTNVLLHAATAVLLFLVLRRMTGRLWPSALVAAVFAVHPLRAESVAWVTERKDVLGGFFFMLAIAAYLHYVNHRFSIVRYLIVLIVFALGLLSKPMVVTLPLVLLLLDYWPLGRWKPEPPQQWNSGVLWRLAIEKLPMVLLAVVVGAVIVGSTNSGDETYWSDTCFRWSWRLENVPISYVTYLGMFFYPANLAIPYPRMESDLSLWKVAGAVLVLAVLTGAALIVGRKRPYLPVGWLWYLVMLLPMSGLLYFDMHGFTTIADRFTYLPQIGLCIALAWGLADALQSMPFRRTVCGVGAILILAALGYSAWRQTSVWRNNETLWKNAVARTSRNRMAYHALGNAYLDSGHVPEAIEQFQASVAIEPNDATVRYNLGVSLAAAGRIDEAIEQYAATVRLDPGNAAAHNNLGNALLMTGRLAKGMEHCREALRLDPELAEARFNIGDVLYSRGRVAEAIGEYRKAVKSKPEFAPAHYHLGIALAARGEYDEAISEYRKALDLKPPFAAEVYEHLRLALIAAGRPVVPLQGRGNPARP
jgi:protein O-mannosyl-transferase